MAQLREDGDMERTAGVAIDAIDACTETTELTNLIDGLVEGDLIEGTSSPRRPRLGARRPRLSAG